MKRIKGLNLILICLILTGCKDTLKCEIDTPNYKSEIKIKFENDKPTTYKQKETMIYSDSLDPESEIYYHSQYEKYSYLITDKHVKISNHNNEVTTKIQYDFTQDKSTGETELPISKNDTREKIKQKLESSSYTCK